MLLCDVRIRYVIFEDICDNWFLYFHFYYPYLLNGWTVFHETIRQLRKLLINSIFVQKKTKQNWASLSGVPMPQIHCVVFASGVKNKIPLILSAEVCDCYAEVSGSIPGSNQIFAAGCLRCKICMYFICQSGFNSTYSA